MKTRDGFISNSSATSFILAIAKVTDLDALKDYLKSNEIRYCEEHVIGFDVPDTHAFIRTFGDDWIEPNPYYDVKEAYDGTVKHDLDGRDAELTSMLPGDKYVIVYYMRSIKDEAEGDEDAYNKYDRYYKELENICEKTAGLYQFLNEGSCSEQFDGCFGWGHR